MLNRRNAVLPWFCVRLNPEWRLKMKRVPARPPWCRFPSRVRPWPGVHA